MVTPNRAGRHPDGGAREAAGAGAWEGVAPAATGPARRPRVRRGSSGAEPAAFGVVPAGARPGRAPAGP
ncbi:hypothetical protein, partial [Streptomyces sp. NPDC097619]|uniref:hypothetical protein n=1 Tax=Streptomyces sp. NPDC097619 TaxID=3157228 RepID=UPI00332928D9